MILWPERVIISAMLEVEARFMRGLTNEQLINCLVSRERWDPYWFAEFWTDLEGSSEQTHSAFLKCYVELVRQEPRLKMCLLTLRGLIFHISV